MAVPEGKPVPRWLTAAASVTVVIDVVLGVLGFLWSPVLWLPGVVLSVIVTYAFIVVRGSAREWKG